MLISVNIGKIQWSHGLKRRYVRAVQIMALKLAADMERNPEKYSKETANAEAA